jgi:hypothetical protein
MFDNLQKLQPSKRSNEDGTEADSCCEDPIGGIKDVFVNVSQGFQVTSGQYPVLRPVFMKPHGVAQATFTVNPNLPDNLRIGVFHHDSFAAWIRFSSDTTPSSPDLKTSLGLGIKLFGVPGRKLLENEEEAKTHDFLLQNHDVFFVDTAHDMCKWAQARVNGMPEDPDIHQRREDMRKVVISVLDTPYWSILPYVFGSDRHVKYKLEPEYSSDIGSCIDDLRDDPNFLRQDLRRRLLKGAASFKFYLQFRTDPDKMPIDKATVRWDETISRPVFVATLTIPQQDIDVRGQAIYGDNLAYNPWHALCEHSPVGSIADARRITYLAAAELRRNLNGIPIAEPHKPRQI